MTWRGGLRAADEPGGTALAAMLVPPPLWRARGRGEWQRLRDGLPVFFSVICLSESYLMRSNTTLLFVMCMTLLYAAAPPADQSNARPRRHGAAN